jgi:hypothetical protein
VFKCFQPKRAKCYERAALALPRFPSPLRFPVFDSFWDQHLRSLYLYLKFMLKSDLLPAGATKI